MIIIGADTHKRSHALAAIDAQTGAVTSQRTIAADEPGHLVALRWARELSAERVWAIEDCRHVSRRLEQALIAVGERVVRVAPIGLGCSAQAPAVLHAPVRPVLLIGRVCGAFNRQVLL